jgi:hypothetical protein
LRCRGAFCQAGFRGKCAIVTSYQPQAGDIAKEDSGEGATERLQYEIYRQMLVDHFNEPADRAMTKVEEFEKHVKERFIHEPGQMRLLIVVDKLLTGFDAPPAPYLYFDKKMRDHGLFQAICRVNRLDGDDKDYGVDYRDLFNSLESAITDYTNGPSTAMRSRTSKVCYRTASKRRGRTSMRRWSGCGPYVSRSRRPRARCSTSGTSSHMRATLSRSKPTSRSALSCTASASTLIDIRGMRAGRSLARHRSGSRRASGLGARTVPSNGGASGEQFVRSCDPPPTSPNAKPLQHSDIHEHR